MCTIDAVSVKFLLASRWMCRIFETDQTSGASLGFPHFSLGSKQNLGLIRISLKISEVGGLGVCYRRC